MKKLKRLSVKSLAIFLSVVLVLLSLPLSVMAQDLIQSDAVEEGDTTEIFELKDQRTETTKTFRLADGSFMIAQYDSTVHYLDENASWQDIDNTLTASGSEISTSNAKIKFAKKVTGNNELFTLHDGNRKLGFALDNANKKVSGKITNYEIEQGEEATQLQKLTTLNKISSAVKYEDIFSGVDLEYVVHGTTIKENIIVKERQSAYTYSFTLSLNNLSAALQENGEIRITAPDTGEVVYLIPAPYMWDAEMSFSTAVTMELTDWGNGKYTLTVTADADWINAEDRVFPITIDPPVYTSSSSSVTDLSFDIGGFDNYANYNWLYVGNEWHSYWKLNTLPPLPDSAYITNALFSMEFYTETELTEAVAVYDVLSDWDATLTYSQVTAASGAKGVPATNYTDFQNIYYTRFDSNYDWNITPIVKKWYSGQNYGLMLAPVTGDTMKNMVSFRSNEWTTASERPQLCIYYQDMKGIEDYWSYTSQSAGFAGVGAINNATGNLVLSIPTLTSIDGLMPFTPTLVYNSALAGRSYISSNAQTSYDKSYMPMGFKLNIQETLLEKPYYDADGSQKTLFVWADADGTEHYFMPTDINGTYEDEDGLLLTLEATTTSCTITDSGDNVRTFLKLDVNTGSGWMLYSISDQNGNKLEFSFEPGTRPISVNLIPRDSFRIEQLRIAYNDSNVPYIVYNPNSNEAVILRYSDTYNGAISATAKNYLRQVVRVHGAEGVTSPNWDAFYDSNANTNTSDVIVDAVAEYTYNASGRIIAVKNGLSQYRIDYSYDSAGRVIHVKEYSLASGSATAGQEIALSYGTFSTEVRTSGSDDAFDTEDDLITTYGFDKSGRTISCYTTDISRTQLYGASHGQYVGEDNEKAKNNIKASVQTTQQSSNYLMNGNFEITATSYVPFWDIGTGDGIRCVKSTEYGESCVAITVNSTDTSATLSQTLMLDPGEYYLAFDIKSSQYVQPDVYIKISSPDTEREDVVKEVVCDTIQESLYVSTGVGFRVEGYEGGKERITVAINVVSNATYAQGVRVDNMMLSKTTGATEYDLLKLGHFEAAPQYLTPQSYWKYLDHETTPITVADSEIGTFGDVLKIDADINNSHTFVYQDIELATDEMKAKYDAGTYTVKPILFNLSAWAKGTAQAHANTSHFHVRLIFFYYNGTTSGFSEGYDLKFDKGITDWQFASGGYVSDPRYGLLESVRVMVMYNDHPGEGYFDNISLSIEPDNTVVYGYGSNGKLSYYQNSVEKIWYDYNDNGDISRSVSIDKSVVDYKYDDPYNPGRLTKEIYQKYTGAVISNPTTITDDQLITVYQITYGYSDYGQVTQITTVDGSDSSKAMVSQIAYNNEDKWSPIFGTVKSETDGLSNTTRYFYNEKNGRLLAVTYPEGNGVCYEYDAMGNITQVLPATLLYNATGYTANTNSASVSYGYNSVTKRLETVTTESTTYQFVYDGFGNTTELSAGDYELASYTYNSNNGKLSILTYGNGHQVKYLYDSLDRIEKIEYNIGEGGAFETVYTYTYDARGALIAIEDHVNQEITAYTYDVMGRLIESRVFSVDEQDELLKTSYTYDEQLRLSASYRVFEYTWSNMLTQQETWYEYGYDTAGHINYFYITDDDYRYDITVNPSYDMFGRLSQRTVQAYCDSNSFYSNSTYQYKQNSTSQSSLVSQLVSQVGTYSNSTSTTTYNYTYDKNGNITQITDADNIIQYKYYYDDLGQLIREDNRPRGYSFVYAYDTAGNITSKKTYEFSTESLGILLLNYAYTYDNSMWGDLLTGYRGNHIAYDEIGNPIRIGSYNATTDDWYDWYELTWEGRQLVSYQYREANDAYSEAPIYFTYNADGIRTSKTVNGITHQYILDGTQIVAEMWTQDGVGYTLMYDYDENGSPLSIRYRTNSYDFETYDIFFFEKNLQGDIVAVYNANGTKIGMYVYDAWGTCTVVHTTTSTSLEKSILSTYNPFRYRGYYYDVETGYYYLQSRYYNPSWGRFLNADKSLNANGDILGFNMFAYCSNNPIMLVDPEGESILGIIALVVLGGGLIAGLSSCSVTYNTSVDDTSDPNSLLGTPADPKSKYVYDSYDEAISAAAEHIAQKTAESGYSVEYGTTIFQYPGDSKYYYNNAKTSGSYHEFNYAFPDGTIPVAIMHSHCHDNSQDPYGRDGLGRENGSRIDSFIVIPPKITVPQQSNTKIYVLYATASALTDFEIYQ